MSDLAWQAVHFLKCPFCGAEPSKSCKDDGRTRGGIHTQRVNAARGFVEDAPFIIHALLEKEKAELTAALREAHQELEVLKAANTKLTELLATRLVENLAELFRFGTAPQLNEEALKKRALDLDWSVRTSNVIQMRFPPTVPLTEITVADLIGVPPKEWLKIRPCGMRVLREMDKMFKELGVEWPGEWPRR